MLTTAVQIEGLVAWIETDEQGDIVDKLGELGIKRSAVFVWVDPNNPSRGCQLVVCPPPSPKQEAAINEWLVERFNPPMNQLPTS